MNIDEALSLLGLTRDEVSDRKNLRRAYLKQVKRCSPERDPEGFLRVRQAFELLDSVSNASALKSLLEEPLPDEGATDSAAEDDGAEVPTVSPEPEPALPGELAEELSRLDDQAPVSALVALLCRGSEAGVARSFYREISSRLYASYRFDTVQEVLRAAKYEGVVGLDREVLYSAPELLSPDDLWHIIECGDPADRQQARACLARTGDGRLAQELSTAFADAHRSPPTIGEVELAISSILGLYARGRHGQARALSRDIEMRLTETEKDLDAPTVLRLAVVRALAAGVFDGAELNRHIARATLAGDPTLVENDLVEFAKAHPVRAKEIRKFWLCKQ